MEQNSQIYSDRFDDVYFSRDGGLDETRHVFLDGNGLPAAWEGRNRFTIVETGFGTGLNFLAAWQLFEQTAAPGQSLDFISFEKYPLTPEVIRSALVPWRDEFEGRMEKMLALYPVRLPGFHRVNVTDRVSLTLIFDDVNEALPKLVVPGGVNAWFLDGFTPAKNPDMWTDILFQGMAERSAPEARVATFTAAGFVRRGLEAAGFTIQKKPGFGRKRDMSAGYYAGPSRISEKRNLPHRIAIIGGGLAGTACAYVLKERGLEPVLFEASDSLAAGASGNRIGMLNPRLYAQRSAEADFYASSYELAGRVLRGFPDSVEFNPCGSLHLIDSDEKKKRFTAMVEAEIWSSEHMRLVDADEAARIAGVPIAQEALYLPDSGAAYPAALCVAYADGADVRLNTPVSELAQTESGWSVNGEAFDAVILACGAAVKNFTQSSWFPVETVRGQVTWIAENVATTGLRCNLCYGGYITPAKNGMHVVGSTFQKWLNHTDLLVEDDEYNLQKLGGVVPALLDDAEITGGRAGLRTASQDRFPLVGAVPDRESWRVGDEISFSNLYASVGHGSHGVISTLGAAVFLADMITAGALSLGDSSRAALAPERFLQRWHRKGVL